MGMSFAYGPTDEAESLRVLARYLELGGNFFDTAETYGPYTNEELLGRFLRNVPRDSVVVATKFGFRFDEKQNRTIDSSPANVRRACDGCLGRLGIDVIDVFFIEYVHPGDDPDVMFGRSGVLDELQQWKENGWVRFVGATAHDRALARRLAADPRVDVLMHRFNMAHRKAAREVFPAAAKARTPIVAFTATRWGTLLEPHADSPGLPPSASDCYRYCLAQQSVQLVLTAPRSLAELEQNLDVLELPAMTKLERGQWQRYGDLVYGAGKGAFETSWP